MLPILALLPLAIAAPAPTPTAPTPSAAPTLRILNPPNFRWSAPQLGAGTKHYGGACVEFVPGTLIRSLHGPTQYVPTIITQCVDTGSSYKFALTPDGRGGHVAYRNLWSAACALCHSNSTCAAEVGGDQGTCPDVPEGPVDKMLRNNEYPISTGSATPATTFPAGTGLQSDSGEHITDKEEDW